MPAQCMLKAAEGKLLWHVENSVVMLQVLITVTWSPEVKHASRLSCNMGYSCMVTQAGLPMTKTLPALHALKYHDLDSGLQLSLKDSR